MRPDTEVARIEAPIRYENVLKEEDDEDAKDCTSLVKASMSGNTALGIMM